MDSEITPTSVHQQLSHVFRHFSTTRRTGKTFIVRAVMHDFRKRPLCMRQPDLETQVLLNLEITSVFLSGFLSETGSYRRRDLFVRHPGHSRAGGI